MTSRGTRYWHSGAIPLIAPEILGDIIAEVADLAIVIAPNGTILSVLVNPMHDTFRRLESWEGKDIRGALTVESVPKFEKRLAAFLDGQENVRPVEINHSDLVTQWEFPILYSFHRIAPDGAILMLGRDLRVVAEMQQQLVQAQIAIERDFEVQREYDTRFRVLMESAREPILFVAVPGGRITDANGAAANLLGRSRENLIGGAFADEFEARGRADLVEALTDLALTDKGADMSLMLRGDQPVRISPTLFRAAGERLLVCRIDESADKGSASLSDALSENLRGLYRNGPDAICFCQSDGTILAANDAFLDLINAAHDVVVRGRPLSEFLQRGSVDVRVMTENANRSGRMRHYPTKMLSDFGSPRPVEIGVTRFEAGQEAVYAFLMRDVTRAEPARPASTPVTDDSVRSVMDLVGSATLKEIVAETTDVVEKMCIETAVELTMNNRVAAAEMLGLSRQSLYVKLRKYGILGRNEE